MGEEGGEKKKGEGKLEDEGKEQDGKRETRKTVAGKVRASHQGLWVFLRPFCRPQSGKGRGDNKASEGL